MSLLRVEKLDLRYGDSQVLWAIDLAVEEGRISALVGANGAGKTTLMRAIAGLVRPSAGRISFGGEDLARVPAETRVRRGIALVPEGRRLFAGLSVRENLMLGAHVRTDRSAVADDLSKIFALFPELEKLSGQIAGTMSGGQQQMCAVGRALMARPRLLLIDEMSLGLAPVVVDRIAMALKSVNAEDGITMLLVEQDVELALEIASHATVMDTGRVVLDGPSTALIDDPKIREAYMGLAA
ncbi:ABC transporter ATP-binding protein [Methylobacterium isbiliense]|uniref:High-affinity branched-chain amino acid transport ATP-binding protein LivF n=1 Tax=Methylobacterium isbiliense TaxID=315478 RepID=A0ABQ4SK81_9HYPH|nr:ABC transporter ATP-binding protein [Methylobacterium isbiliense]MDN3627133.1 ABC transporter ATP-binding protein [Methylobacterium isbiliense]GJE03611.1 High-affinity branched-chain amino acid transport ATP-binding protein LivF [Methylobacterium isbiliense]